MPFGLPHAAHRPQPLLALVRPTSSTLALTRHIASSPARYVPPVKAVVQSGLPDQSQAYTLPTRAERKANYLPDIVMQGSNQQSLESPQNGAGAFSSFSSPRVRIVSSELCKG